MCTTTAEKEPVQPLAETRTSVFFTPSDTSGSGTVIILYNTTGANRTVRLTAYKSSGDALADSPVKLPPRERVVLVSDAVVANPPPSWANPVTVNFTDFSTYGRLLVPSGVVVDSYVVYNAQTGTIDPDVDHGARPLRFSTQEQP